MRIKQKDIYNFGVDYIEVVGTLKKLDQINFGLGSFEGNTGTLFPDFTIRRDDRVLNYQYKIVFNYKGIDCFAYHVGQENGAITTNDFMSVYGTAFTLFPELSEIIDFVEKEMDVVSLRRFDLAIDVLFHVKDIHKGFKEVKQKGSIFLDDMGDIQTFYIGEKKKKNNRYKLIRAYNKKDDIYIRKRQRLFPDYLKQENVTRIEIEIRSELAKDCSLSQLLDRSFIFNLFLTYIGGYTTMFSHFDYEVTRLNQINKKVDVEDLKMDEYIKQRYFNTFIGYGKSIIEVGGCPVDILIRSDLISEDTKSDIALSIIDGEFRQDKYEFGLNVRTSRDVFSQKEDNEIQDEPL